MEIILYILGNFVCNLATLIPFAHYHAHEMQPWDPADWDPVAKDKQTPTPYYGMISKDLKIMCTIGTAMRVYWSTSAPPVWEDEVGLLKDFAMLDVFYSPLLWFWLLCNIGLNQERTAEEKWRPWYAKWYYLMLITCAFGVLGDYAMPHVMGAEEHEVPSYPFAGVVVISNMTVDSLAMVYSSRIF